MNQAATDPATDDNTKPDQIVVSAAALGWALTEMLGRCFNLTEPSQEEKDYNLEPWLGKSIRILPPILNDREQIYSVLFYIESLAKQLQVDTLPIPKEAQPSHDGQSYWDFINTNVQQLCHAELDWTADKPKQLRGSINERLYFWDIMIREALQKKSDDPQVSYTYVNAFMVGRSFAALRWYYGQKGLANENRDILNADSLKRLNEHVKLLDSFLLPYAALALTNSLEHWGTAILEHRINAAKSPELQLQAVIWHDLLVGNRQPTTYVAPSSVTWRYILRVIAFSLPIILLGILLAAGITFLFAFLLGKFWIPSIQVLNKNPTLTSIETAIGAGFALLAGIGTAIPTVKTVWDWATKKVGTNIDTGADTIVTSVGSALGSMFWNAAQQHAINKATYVAVP